MKKILKVSIVIISIVAMLCVWPICLVRETEIISSSLTSQEYGASEQYVSQEMPYIQSFEAQTSRLDWIEFKLLFEQDISTLTGKFDFKLMDKNDKVIFEQEVAAAEYKSFFWHVDINKWLHKGEVYRFVITVEKDLEGIFSGFYTVNEEEHAVGSAGLMIGEQQIAGQGVARYGYGVPISINNILCLWAFILTVGISFLQCCNGTRESRIPNTLSKLWDKFWELLKKHQTLILSAEICVILLLIIYICRNMAVDWDEAFSIMMISRLNLKEMIYATVLDVHPPLYYLLLRAMVIVFGADIFTLKLLSVFFTGCVMLLGMTLVRKNWGAKVAFLFILITGLGPRFIMYAVNIRMYEMALFFVTASAVLAYEIIKNPNKKLWICFVLSSLGGVYTHYFAVFPLVIIYGYLMLGLLIERREALKGFWFSCIGTIVGYLPWILIFVICRMKGVENLIGHLPWLSTVISSDHESMSGSFNFSKLDFAGLVKENFDTNIKYSVEMYALLFLVSIVLFVIRRKRLARKEKLFLVMCAGNMFLSYLVIALLASTNTHFITGRYVFAALGIFWLFMIIILVRNDRLVACVLTLNLTLYVWAAYTIQKSTELDTNTYLYDTYAVLEQVQDEEVVLYNFPTYHILYGAHLPEQQFVWIYDMDWEHYEQDYIYFICWGANWFTADIQEKYQLQFEECGVMRFEEGMAGVKLFKVNISKK